MDINIEEINMIRNARTNSKDDITELMNNIRQHGLLQPIAVYQEDNGFSVAWGHRRLEAIKKLGWNKLAVGKEIIIVDKSLNEESYLLKNLSENIQRKDLSPVEAGKVYDQLMHGKYPLSIKELSAKLNISAKSIETAIKLYHYLPSDIGKLVGYRKQHSHRVENNGVSVNIAKWFADSFNKETACRLIIEAKRQNWTEDQARIMRSLLNSGMLEAKAKQEVSNYKIFYVTIPIKKDDYNILINKYHTSIQKIILMHLLGRIVLPNSIFDKNLFQLLDTQLKED